MSNDRRFAEIQSDIRAIKMQLEALMYESRLTKLDTLTFLLELAYKEASEQPDPASRQTCDPNTPPTIQ